MNDMERMRALAHASFGNTEPLRRNIERDLAAARLAGFREGRERAAVLVEFTDLFWDRGDPRTRIAAAIRALPAEGEKEEK